MRLKVLIKLFVCAIIIGFGVWGWYYIHTPGRFPIKTVKIDGTYHYISQSMLKDLLLPQISNGFFNLDVNQLQNQLAKIPGIKSAGIRRSWPSTVHVTLNEYVAKAYWNKNAIITDDSKIFTPKVMLNLPDLAHLYSNRVHADLMLRTYSQLEALASKYQLTINDLTFTANQWSIKLSDGTIVILGSANPLKQLKKLLAVLPEINQANKQIARIDMRYTNGFAVDFKKK
ncbi:FtsQ-type POTRA domain-containing protein [Thiotrichales bacterium 19S3-7]|nr:FtsQ-type POTRA domain-containing protein [Thiotrichales bacterium 19S3-7]MCF6802888.1 FtsQ-type POTRA domain-containing protein [Thiotrichales bacterium 19S3-11]